MVFHVIQEQYGKGLKVLGCDSKLQSAEKVQSTQRRTEGY